MQLAMVQCVQLVMVQLVMVQLDGAVRVWCSVVDGACSWWSWDMQLVELEHAIDGVGACS